MTGAENRLILRPALSGSSRPTWDGAVWIGEIWADAVDAVDRRSASAGLAPRCTLEQSTDYHRARLLVRTDSRVFGFIELEVLDAEVDWGTLKRLVSESVAAAGRHSKITGAHSPAVTVVICTRDRFELLKGALESVLGVDYPNFDVVVVDNASSTGQTREYVGGLSDPRLRLIEEPQPGVSRARNAGLWAAKSNIVAFADDDVVVDRMWLRALVDGFTRGESVACVSGMVPAGEIRTPAQAYFDRRVGWSSSTKTRIFELAHPPDDVPLFPFAVRCYGTGANFAVDRDVVRSLGFDETLGAGVPTGGGEDLDLFFRVLLAGRQLVHEPAAIVWHRHRADNAALLTQTCNYGLGLGAWLAKVASNPVTARLAIATVMRRAPAFVRHLRAASAEVTPGDNLAEHLPSRLGDSLWRQVARGAVAYRRAQRDVQLPKPFGEPSHHVAAAASRIGTA